jgi:hypothetical protein
MYEKNIIKSDVGCDIKYYLFHDLITIIKFIIFKLKIININIYFLKLFYNLNFKSIINQTF